MQKVIKTPSHQIRQVWWYIAIIPAMQEACSLRAAQSKSMRHYLKK
jgi:hypothetical protein